MVFQEIISKKFNLCYNAVGFYYECKLQEIMEDSYR